MRQQENAIGMASLNPEQEQAAAHRDGPMLVLAGPGTGKTATLVARYARLVREDVEPGAILSITFTRMAAEQLKTRIGRITGQSPKEIAAGTFHAFCRTLLRRFPSRFGELSRRRLVDESEQLAILRNLGNAWMDGEEHLLGEISRLKDGLITPDRQAELAEMAPRAKKDAAFRLAEAYAAYERHLREANLVDFGDLIMAVVEAMKDPNFARALSGRFRYLMVDEYQDINLAQHELINGLLSAHRNLWAVGDDDQALYGWRGSDVRFILDFQRNYPGTKLVRLVRNYRSTSVIIKAANGLIANNRERLGKELISQSGAGNGAPIDIRSFATPAHEAGWIARTARNLIEAGMPPPQIAVLGRVGHHLTEIERAFEREMIPVDLAGVSRFWALPEIKIGLRAIARMTGEMMSEYGDRIPVWLEDKIGSEVRGLPFHRAAARVCDVLLRNPPGRATPERKDEWRCALEQLKDEVTACRTADELRRRIRDSFAEKESEAGAVRISSIHAAKGLEWRVVFLAGCEADLLPHKKSEDLEEERRLAFVAVTRAKESLFVSYCAERRGQDAGPSDFIEEMLSGLEPGVDYEADTAERDRVEMPSRPVIRPRPGRAMFRLWKGGTPGEGSMKPESGGASNQLPH
jgi:DNA helicase-2/ATP-dependent DNA helicase PcrA